MEYIEDISKDNIKKPVSGSVIFGIVVLGVCVSAIAFLAFSGGDKKK
ncbi:MAG: hypothetical protein AAB649_04800 [Patescibacteria group bacterium]